MKGEEERELPIRGSPAIMMLIDQLQETAEGDMGYMASMSGSKFSPLEDAGKPGAMLLGQKAPTGSPALCELVKKGVAAVPILIAHLDDGRKTRMTIKH